MITTLDVCPNYRIAVIGGGISGFSTALCIKNSIDEANVTVISDQFIPDITSNSAAGLIGMHCVGKTSVELLQKWVQCTIDHLKDIYYNHSDAGSSGISPISGIYLFKNKLVPKMPNAKCVFHHHFLSPDELQVFPDYQSGQYISTMVAECALYMPWLMKQFLRKRGNIIKKRIQNIEELISDYDIIINCSGLGSIDLFKDNSLKPIRGQVIKVEAPWVKQFIEDVDHKPCTYIIPGSSAVTLGGMYQHNDWNQNVDKMDSIDIMERCYKLLPSLAYAKTIKESVGLRPYRPDGVRLELEYIDVGEKNTPVVHNYGHGGAGVSLSWGCAVDATDIVKTIMNKSKL